MLFMIEAPDGEKGSSWTGDRRCFSIGAAYSLGPDRAEDRSFPVTDSTISGVPASERPGVLEFAS